MKRIILILFMILSNLAFADIQSDVKNNNLEGIKKYLEKEEKTYYYTDTLNELLSDAIYYGSADIEKFLLEKGATYDGALSIEVSRGRDSEKIEKILKKGANPNYKNKFGETTLHKVAKYNEIEFAKLLLKHGGDPSIKNNEGKNSYDLAAADGYTEMLKVLPNTEKEYFSKSKKVNRKEKMDSLLEFPDWYGNMLYILSFIFPPLAFLLMILYYLWPFLLLIMILLIYYMKRRKKYDWIRIFVVSR